MIKKSRIVKIAIIFAFIIATFAAATLAACGTVDYDAKFADKAKVIFELEGGKYQNHSGMTSVSHYYTLGEGETCKIVPLEEIGEVKRDGDFALEGWFRTKTAVDDGFEYSDQWDFANDRITKEGVTLYAKWKAPIYYTFDFIYVDESGKETVVQSYRVNEGNTLGEVHGTDYLTLAEFTGHTAVAIYYDKEHTKPFDDSERHPGGEESFAIKLYAEYIDGSFKFVRTADDLKNLGTKGIYLLADIDLGGKPFSLTNFSGKTLLGNGHKISNFTIAYSSDIGALEPDLDDSSKSSLYVSIFGNTKDVTVKDVTFENVSVVIDTFLSRIHKIYVAPLATSVQNGTFENVKVTGSFGYTSRTDKDKLVFAEGGFVHSENTTENGCTYEIELLGVV